MRLLTNINNINEEDLMNHVVLVRHNSYFEYPQSTGNDLRKV